MKEHLVEVKYSDRNKPGERQSTTLAVEAESEFQALAEAGVGVIFREGSKLYGGNIAHFSDVQTSIIHEPLEFECPSN